MKEIYPQRFEPTGNLSGPLENFKDYRSGVGIDLISIKDPLH